MPQQHHYQSAAFNRQTVAGTALVSTTAPVAPTRTAQATARAFVQYVYLHPRLLTVYCHLLHPLVLPAEAAYADSLYWNLQQHGPNFWDWELHGPCAGSLWHDGASFTNTLAADPEPRYPAPQTSSGNTSLCVALHPLLHHGRECIALRFDRKPQLEQWVRRLPQVRWSQTHHCWYLPMIAECYLTVKQTLNGIAVIDETELRRYGQRRKAVASTYPSPETMVRPAVFAASPAWQLSAENLKELERFVQQLKLLAYSQSTLNTYRAEFMQLLKLLRSRTVDTLTPEELRRYMLYTLEREGISEQTAHGRINAIKFYFEQVLGKEKFFYEIPRPKRRLVLPKVLSERELERLFASVTNLKHKALLFAAYSAGLRVSEVSKLKIAHIDSDRMQILVAQAKGKKDRYVGLSVLLLDVLRAYLKQARPRPAIYLFEGGIPGTPLSTRSAQGVFRSAKLLAGIRKEVSFHALRHSFATHLLEKGIDIKYIKDLLGHFQIKTTERYLHVRREDLVQLVNPLDELYRGKAWDE